MFIYTHTIHRVFLGCGWEADDGRGAEFARGFAAEEQRERPPWPTRRGALTLHIGLMIYLALRLMK